MAAIRGVSGRITRHLSIICRTCLAVCSLVGFATVLDGAEWVIDTVAGNGTFQANTDRGRALDVAIGDPFGVEIGPDGRLYVTEVRNHRIWAIDLQHGSAEVVVGSGERGYRGDGGPARQASLNEPYEVRFDRQGRMYFVEMQNHVVRRVETDGTITTVAGTGQPGYSGDGGPAVAAQLRQPHSIALDESGTWLFIADIGNHRIRAVNLTVGTITSLAGTGERLLPADGMPAANRPVLGPRALFVQEGRLWVALREGHSVWRLEGQPWTWRFVAGTGQSGYDAQPVVGSVARFNGPKGIAVDGQGNIYIADTENHAIRRIDARTALVTTIAGSGPNSGGYSGDQGPAQQARLNRPHGICVASDGTVFVGDTLNHRVRRIRWQ